MTCKINLTCQEPQKVQHKLDNVGTKLLINFEMSRAKKDIKLNQIGIAYDA
jgi:hypothetical protein